jgi:lysophospholipase L1-like esterase
MSVQVSYKKQFLLGFLLLITAIAIFEVTARTYELFNPHCTFLDKDAFSETDYFLTRIICLDHNSRVFEKDVIRLMSPNQYSQTININSHGFRGEEIIAEKLENTYRIFVVGGSTTFGVGSTSDNTTIPGYLQEKINDSKLDFTVEVINAGIGGADSASESFYITNYLMDFKPDLFIIYDGWNDAINTVKYVEYKNIENQSVKNDEIKPIKFANFPFYRTPFVIHDILFWNPDFSAHNIVDPDLISVKTDLWKKRWQDICEKNESEKIKTVLIVQPILGTGNKTLSTDESLMVPKLDEQKIPLKILDSFANELPTLGKYCDKTIDLRNIFDDTVEPIYFDLGHPTDKGNKIVAEKIYEIIFPIIVEDIQNPS